MLANVFQKVDRVFHHNAIQAELSFDGIHSGISELMQLMDAKQHLFQLDLQKKRGFVNKLHRLLNIDESACQATKQETHNYLITLRNNEKLKKDAREVVCDYLMQLYQSYTIAVDGLQDKKTTKFSKEKIKLILARYLNTIFTLSKWRYFDDQPAALGMWTNVHKVIKLAENLSVMDDKFFLYESQHKETSIAAILECGFMLDTLQKESYSPLQIELTERILKTWSNPKLTHEYQAGEYHFFIHLDGDKRPQRVRGARQHPDFLYWKTSYIIDLIESYLCAVDTGRSLESFNLITIAAVDDIVRLFKKLRIDWRHKGYARQRRSEGRNSKGNILDVMHGIDVIYERVRHYDTSSFRARLEMGDSVNTLQIANQKLPMQSIANDLSAPGYEHWTMLDESSSGFSAHIEKSMHCCVQSGSLIGYTSAENPNTVALAEIRSLRKTTSCIYRAGLVKLSSQPIAVKVYQEQKSKVFTNVSDYEVKDISHDRESFSEAYSGLLIEGSDMNKPRLIVPRHLYKPSARYKVVMNNQEHYVLAGQVKNKHRSWVCFEIIV